jgi:hypothetical protein
LCVHVGPGRGQLVSPQCLSLARGVCTLTYTALLRDMLLSKKEPRTRAKERKMAKVMVGGKGKVGLG